MKRAGIAPRLFLCPLLLLIWVHPLGNALFFCLYIACKISIYYQHGGNKRKSQKRAYISRSIPHCSMYFHFPTSALYPAYFLHFSVFSTGHFPHAAKPLYSDYCKFTQHTHKNATAVVVLRLFCVLIALLLF